MSQQKKRDILKAVATLKTKTKMFENYYHLTSYDVLDFLVNIEPISIKKSQLIIDNPRYQFKLKDLHQGCHVFLLNGLL